jgi:hypothetical protein
MKLVLTITLLLLSGCLHLAEEIDRSSFYGTWKGAEFFRVEMSDQVGDPPFCLCQDGIEAACENREDVKCEHPEGEVELTLIMTANECLIFTFDNTAKDCVFDTKQMIISVPGGMYGAHHESGYQIMDYTDQEIQLTSELSNWVDEEQYSYTYKEFGNAVLTRQN